MSQVELFGSVFGQVERSLQNRRYYEALRQLSEVSLSCSKDVNFLVLMARTQAAIKDYQNLIATQNELVRQRGTVADRLNLMVAYYTVDKINQALDIGLQLQGQPMTFAEEQKLSKIMVRIYLEENDFEGAAEVIAQSLQSEEDDFLLWAQGIIFLHNDQKEKALDYFRKAVQLNTKNDQAWVSLGLMHKEMGDETLSLANIEKAIDLNPYNVAALKQLSSSAVKHSDKAEAAFAHMRFYLSKFCFDEEISLCHIQMLCHIKAWDIANLELDKLLLHRPENAAVKNVKKSMMDAQMMC